MCNIYSLCFMFIRVFNVSIDFIAANDSSCINGAIRLNPLNKSISATQGLVEICIAGRWNKTCSSNISNGDARALCTIMRLPSKRKFKIMYLFNFMLSLIFFFA